MSELIFYFFFLNARGQIFGKKEEIGRHGHQTPLNYVQSKFKSDFCAIGGKSVILFCIWLTLFLVLLKKNNRKTKNKFFLKKNNKIKMIFFLQW